MRYPEKLPTDRLRTQRPAWVPVAMYRNSSPSKANSNTALLESRPKTRTHRLITPDPSQLSFFRLSRVGLLRSTTHQPIQQQTLARGGGLVLGQKWPRNRIRRRGKFCRLFCQCLGRTCPFESAGTTRHWPLAWQAMRILVEFVSAICLNIVETPATSS